MIDASFKKISQQSKHVAKMSHYKNAKTWMKKTYSMNNEAINPCVKGMSIV